MRPTASPYVRSINGESSVRTSRCICMYIPYCSLTLNISRVYHRQVYTCWRLVIMTSLLMEQIHDCRESARKDSWTLASKCQHCCAVFHELRKFQKEELLCDVTVLAGSAKQTVKAHRVVLMSAKSLDSDYHSDMESASDTSDTDDDSVATVSYSDESVFEEAYAPEDEATHITKLMECINTLRQRGQCCDVTLQASGVQYKAHRCVLAAASDYFKIMFTSCMKERNMQVIPLTLERQFDDAHLQSVLDYIYSGEMCLHDDNIMPVLCISAFLQIPTLINLCQNYLISQVSMVNCCGYYVLAKCFALERLKTESRKIIHDHFPELEGLSDDINLLEKVDLPEILQSDDLGQCSPPAKKTESRVLNNVLEWLADAKFQDASELLSHVRFTLVPKKDIESHRKTVEDNTIAFQDQKDIKSAQRFLQKALDYHGKLYEQPLLQTPHSNLRASSNNWICLDGVLAPETVKLASMCLHAKSPAKEQRKSDSDKIRDPFHSVVVVNGFVYVIGGTRQTSTGYSKQVLRYDSRLDTWIQVAFMNEERGDFFACAIGNCLYVFGGRNKRGAVSSCERYDLRKNRWERISDLPEALYMMAGVVENGKVYISGGFTEYEAVGTILKYDPEIDQWTDLPGNMFKDRGYHVMLSDARGSLWAIGGVDNPFAGRNVWEVERFDVECEMWEYVGQVLAVQPFLSIQRLNGFFDKQGRICVFAVTNIDQSPMLRYSIEENLWETLNEPMDYFEIGLSHS